MTETQVTYEARRHCKNCGLRVDGICTLKEAEQIECLSGDERTHWRLKIESVNPGTGHARTCRCDTCLEYWERQQVEPDRKVRPEVNGESVKDFNRNQEGMPCDFCSHHINSEPSFCVTCDPENSNYDAYEFGVESDTIKKNNHDVDVDEMVRGKALKKALEIINGERQDSYGNPEDSFQLIADYWTCYLESVGAGTGQMIKPRQVAEMMALFKIARMSGQKTTADSYADCAGYIGLAGDMI
jgi:hypothetical protein